jgi:hypothetical protein
MNRRSSILALAALSAFALVPIAHGTRPATTAPPPLIDVHVRLTDARIALDRKRAPRGSYVRFILANIGSKRHGFTLGTATRGAGVQTGFSRTLKPNEQTILILYLDYRGRLPYYSRLPEDRSKPGMKGTFTIT